MSTYSKKEIFSIPNMLSFFRVILIPVFLFFYFSEDVAYHEYWAALTIGVSGLTDMLDGYIARKFNMVTEFGKLLDPVADKLTQAAIIFSLMHTFRILIPIAILFVVKESFMGIMGLLLLKRKNKKLDGARWYGKVATAIIYIVIFVVLLFPSIPHSVTNCAMFICGLLLLLSFVMYGKVLFAMWREDETK